MIRPILLAVSILSFALLVVSGQTAGCWCSALPATTAPGCWPEPRWHHPGGVIMVPSRRSSHRASSRSAQIWSHRRNHRPDRTKHLQQAPRGKPPGHQHGPAQLRPVVSQLNVKRCRTAGLHLLPPLNHLGLIQRFSYGARAYRPLPILSPYLEPTPSLLATSHTLGTSPGPPKPYQA